MSAKTSVPEPVLERLRTGRRFLITSHLNPDGDAIGSAIGMSRLLKKLGKSATAWSHDEVPHVYRALPDGDLVHQGREAPAGFPERFDTAIVLECTSPDRTGLEDALAELPIVNIDHHLGNEAYGVVNWVDPSAPAVGAMVHRLAAPLNVALDPDTANALYVTLVTDTGGFRYSNTTPEAFEAAADLVREGASPEVVTRWLYESQPESALRLVGEMLATLELHHGGRIATAWLTRDMIERSGARPGDSEGLIDYPRSIAGVDVTALFRQLDDGTFKVSMRSRGGVSVEKIARRYGGGGHRNAAGFSSELERQHLFEETLSALVRALE